MGCVVYNMTTVKYSLLGNGNVYYNYNISSYNTKLFLSEIFGTSITLENIGIYHQPNSHVCVQN
jgi:hypothetical protein